MIALALKESGSSLEKSFFSFLRSLPDIEIIDDLSLTDDQKQSERADALLSGRRIVCEVKSLHTDVRPKVDRILEPFKNSEHWPVFFGAWEVEHLLKYLPDGKRLRARIVKACTDRIEADVRKANSQIRSTKRSFGLGSASGLLVLLNDLVETLPPNLLVNRLRHALAKRQASGDLCFPEVSAALILSETHCLDADGRVYFPVILVDGNRDAPDPGRAKRYLEELTEQWSQFVGIPYADVGQAVELLGRVKSVSDWRWEHRPMMKRQELWNLQYQRLPYLSQLTEAAFAHYGRNLFRALSATLLKVGPTVTQDERHHLAERFGHLLAEVNRRGFDIRLFKFNEIPTDVLTGVSRSEFLGLVQETDVVALHAYAEFQQASKEGSAAD